MPLNELANKNQSTKVPVRQKGRLRNSLSSLHEDIDRMIHEFFHDPDYPEWISSDKFPHIDMIENGDTYKVKVELAGILPEDVEVSITDGFLTIKGEKQEDKSVDKDDYIRHEISYGAFERVIALPQAANCDKAEATFKNSVLNVEVPKNTESIKQPQKLVIKKVA